MEPVILDQPFSQPENAKVTYGGFWVRLGALLLDGIILAPISFGLTYFNIIEWKSSMLFIAITVVGTAYKPFMEYTYGATLGKMALKLKVVTQTYEKADLGKILLRNIFNILPALVTLVLTLGMFADPDFESVTGFQDYAIFSQRFTSSQYFSYANSVLMLVEAIMIGTDDQKRSLHDRIAGTYVIER